MQSCYIGSFSVVGKISRRLNLNILDLVHQQCKMFVCILPFWEKKKKQSSKDNIDNDAGRLLRLHSVLELYFNLRGSRRKRRERGNLRSRSARGKLRSGLLSRLPSRVSRFAPSVSCLRFLARPLSSPSHFSACHAAQAFAVYTYLKQILLLLRTEVRQFFLQNINYVTILFTKIQNHRELRTS